MANGPVVLVGSSMGGRLALDAALELPGRVAGLLLLAPSTSGAPAPDEADLDARTVALDAEVDAAIDAWSRRVELPGTAHLPSPERPLVADLVPDVVERVRRRAGS